MSQNKTVVQVHGCIICAKLFNVLAVYAPDGELLDCTVTSPGGHIISNEGRILVTCDVHVAEQIEPFVKIKQPA